MKINGLQAEIEKETVIGRPPALNTFEKKFVERCYKKGIRATKILAVLLNSNKKVKIDNIYLHASLSGITRKYKNDEKNAD